MVSKKFFKSLLTTASVTCSLTCGVADANAVAPAGGARWVINDNACYSDGVGSLNWATGTAAGTIAKAT